MSTKNFLTIVVALMVSLCFGSVALAADIDVTGGSLDGATVTAGTDSGFLSVDVYEYTSPTIGSHHWFSAVGGFDATVSVSPGSPGSGLVATTMHGTSRSPASFVGGGAQNFDATATYPKNSWGQIEYSVSGSVSAELDTVIGGDKSNWRINGSWSTLITASGTYDAYVGAALVDSTSAPFDTVFDPYSDMIAGGYLNFWNSSPGSVIFDDPTPGGLRVVSSQLSISIPDNKSWKTTGSGYLEMEGYGAGGISNWNGQSISGPHAYATQYIEHGSDWDYFAGIMAEK